VTTAGAFRLTVEDDGVATLLFDLPERRANIFTREVLAELEALITDIGSRRDLRALVLGSGKSDIFIAGADVDEIAAVTDPRLAEEGSRYGHRLFGAWAALPFPTVAAIRGTCVGGGTELSLASTWIVASDRADLKIGLPEVQLGIVPGWGGCTRLPRRVGLVPALDLILTGKTIAGRRALAIGLADALLPDAGFPEHALAFVRERLTRPRRARKPGLRRALVEGNPIGRAVALAQARRQALAKTRGRYPAPLRALDVVAVGLADGEAAGFAAEAKALGELAVSPQAKNLIHVFRLIEASKKEGEGAPPPPVRRPAVLGAGVMGGGIGALVAQKAGLPVRIKDVRAEALTTALGHAAELLGKQVKRRRLKPAEMRRKLALLQPTFEDRTLDGADFVIEAIVENLAVKQQVVGELGQRLAPDAIVASNTSSLSIDAIGERVPHRERVVGMHFFNPVDKMPLVEVVVGPRTSPAAARAVAAFARKLGKTPVTVRECPGFLVNRLLAFYSAEALWLLDEGYRVEEIDRAMLDWGMPMGPLRLADEVGLDVSAKVGHILHEAFGERLPFPPWLDRLSTSGRLGVKNGKGIYRYEGRKEAGVDPAVYAELGVRSERRAADLVALAERMVLPMVNEAARCLDERIVDGPGPLDLALIFGTGFPPFRGGLCRWADATGLDSLVTALERLAVQAGARFTPSEPLRALAARGGFYASATKVA
jgi:3-hydroxyacyl-CoA dehydrogenase/enoyl-CoA hydratase/3-hydroxybutyryl-CoA epimerase